MTGNGTAIPGLREKVDRILQEVWTPPIGTVPNSDDAVLLTAAWEFRRLQKIEGCLSRARHDRSGGRKEDRSVFLATEWELERLSPRWNALFEFIYLTPAVGLVGAAVKLRLLTDRAIGLAAGFEDEVEGIALRDVRRIVERELRRSQHEKRRR